MISPLLKITALALICSLSLAGITFDVASPEYDNKAISKTQICDHTKPTEFPPAYKTSFNCTSFVVLGNGNYACNDNPCQVSRTIGQWLDCSWQITSSNTLSFLVGGTSTYVLRPCYKCPTPDCQGRSYSDYRVCRSGKMVTSDYGESWSCQDSKCTGEMKMQPDRTYSCVSSTCASVMIYEHSKWICPGQSSSSNPVTPVNSDSSSSSVMPWVIIVLLSCAVIYQALQKRNQEKRNQFNTNHFQQFNANPHC